MYEIDKNNEYHLRDGSCKARYRKHSTIFHVNSKVVVIHWLEASRLVAVPLLTLPPMPTTISVLQHHISAEGITCLGNMPSPL